MAAHGDLSGVRPHGRHSRPVEASFMEQSLETLRLGLVALLVGLWLTGAYAGIVYWSLHGSLLGVIVSAAVAGMAAASTWSLYFKLGGEEDR